MAGFIARRVLLVLPSLFGLLVVTFLLIRTVPADISTSRRVRIPRNGCTSQLHVRRRTAKP